ncbi:hypothetical protein BDQ94DRAFT_134393 [Aspergillus welwitschiae]|uniref:Uncharacterized protein n=1 Tax=Aspergillus welwitschiae TaxID=1341132 RepID=A0A3F3QHB0_9EURO|nr:hypothetical protein BDQ94DRAFT_134393 [Aspergillus welwitschiae]RDH38668.1 hypothetical protein BDQ94DRAFT_134393 [Aspergillus welwitschiae]
MDLQTSTLRAPTLSLLGGETGRRCGNATSPHHRYYCVRPSKTLLSTLFWWHCLRPSPEYLGRRHSVLSKSVCTTFILRRSRGLKATYRPQKVSKWSARRVCIPHICRRLIPALEPHRSWQTTDYFTNGPRQPPPPPPSPPLPSLDFLRQVTYRGSSPRASS